VQLALPSLRLSRYSILMPASFTTQVHFAISLRMLTANASAF